MARLLADENLPDILVSTLRSDAHDVAYMREVGPGSPDEDVMARARDESRIVLTLDKDFGELAFQHGHWASFGIILLRPRLADPDHLIRLTRAAFGQNFT